MAESSDASLLDELDSLASSMAGQTPMAAEPPSADSLLGELDALASEMATSAPEPAAAAEAAAPAAAAPQGSGDLSDLLAAFGEVMPEQPAEPEPEREPEPGREASED